MIHPLIGGLMANVSAWSLVKNSLCDLQRIWPQLVFTDLFARILAIVIIAPAVGLLGKLFLWRTTTGVVTDEAIVSFLLHPFGMAALVVVATVSLGVLFAEIGQLMVVGWLGGFAVSRGTSNLGILLIGLSLVIIVTGIANLAVLSSCP